MAIRYQSDELKAACENGEIKCFMLGTDSFGRIAIAFRWGLDAVSPHFGPNFSSDSQGDLTDKRALARFIADRRNLKRVTWVRDLGRVKAKDVLVIDVQNDFGRVAECIRTA